MLGGQTIATGFSHCCAITKEGDLKVWGCNENNQLTLPYPKKKNTEVKDKDKDKKKKDEVPYYIIERPQGVPLKYKSTIFKAESVHCGPNYTMVIARNLEKKALSIEDDDYEILNPLKEILLKRGTLARFFGLIGKRKKIIKEKKQVQGYNGGQGGQINEFLQEDNSDQDDEEQRLKTEEAESLVVSRSAFTTKIENAGFTQKKNNVQNLADKLLMNEKSDDIQLGDIEDYVLGYRQNACKVFTFGQGHKKIFAFQKKPLNAEHEEMKDYDEDEDEDEQDATDRRQKQLHKHYQNEIIVVARPTVIKFPKQTRPIKVISCGSAHILAVSEDMQMFSWGCGQYGALGFGKRDDIWEPTRLEIFKKDQLQKIIGIACGKFHSLCISMKKKIYAWGMGQGGRLGHGDEEDMLIPKDINDLSKRKVIFVSAGESHSAAITEKLKLYTWGTGSYGRLGLGLDTNERRPKQVDYLDQYEVIQVSCGAFHSLVLTGDGQTWGFGQGKYGKIGVNRKDREGIFQIPQKILIYKIDTYNKELLGANENLQVIEDKGEPILVQAAYNHSMLLTKQGKVYTWGYHGKGILARPKGQFEYLAAQVVLKDYIKMPNFEQIIKRSDNKEEQTFSYEINQISCGHMNTMALTNGGEVYVFGSNTYGQLGKGLDPFNPQEKKRRLDPNKMEADSMNDFQNNINLLRFPGEHSVRISFVACGGEHLFAISRMNELFGWGRNDEGQLGLGTINNFINEPMLITDIAHKSIQFIACGDNYSAAVSQFGEVFVTGNVEGGKLGLGKAYTSGLLLNFMIIPDLPPIKSVACGPSHMLALSEFQPENAELRDGATYSWGRNWRGQLGIGSKEDQNAPRKIINVKERFSKVLCGQNFSIAIAAASGNIYFWGNFKYMCGNKEYKDLEEPTPFKELDMINIKDVACCYKYCIALNDKGEMFYWGSYLHGKHKKYLQNEEVKVQLAKHGSGFEDVNQKDNQLDMSQNPALVQKTIEVKTLSKLNQKNTDLMYQISTGPSHSSSLSVKKTMYTWGTNETGRLGLEQKDVKRARREPTLVSFIFELMQKNRQNLKEGIREGGDDENQNDQRGKNKNDQQQQDGKQSQQQNQKGGQKDNGRPMIMQTEDKEEQKMQEKDQDHNQQDQDHDKPQEDNEEEKKDNMGVMEANQAALEEQDDNLDDNIEDEIMQQEKMPQEKLNLVSLTRQQSMIEAHILLQKLLKKEKKECLDEEYILRFDDEIQKEIKTVLAQFHDFQSIEKARKDSLTQIQSSLLQRITETPFNIDILPSTRIKGLENDLVKYKKTIRNLFTFIHVHPCYLIKVYQNKLMSPKEYTRVIKEIYSYQNERVDYLLMALCQGIIDEELKKYSTIEEVDFLSEESVFGKIVKYIFKSQETNIDTLCCISGHVINKLLNKLSQSSTALDNTLDVTDKLNKQNKQFEAEKSNKNATLLKRSKMLYEFVEEIIKEIMDDDILSTSSTYFGLKANVDMKKKSMNADGQLKVESMRFSPEVSFLAELISKKLRNLPARGPIDDIVNSKVLSLIFSMLDKIWKDYEVYLYPYIKEIKRISILEDVIKKTHHNNLCNIFHVLSCFFNSQQAFAESNNENWNKDLQLKLNHLQQSNKAAILTRIIDTNQMKSINFKNFENLVLHSLEGEGHTITVRKRTIGKIYKLFYENQGNVCIIKPANLDPMIKILNQLPASINNLSKLPTHDKINYKLKTRLLIDEEHAEATRCGDCSAILVQSYSPPESVGILDKYNPEDSQSLAVQYCRILKHRDMKDFTKADNVIEFLDKTYAIAKKNSQFDFANMLIKFLSQVEIQVTNIQNKKMNQQNTGGALDNDQKIKESIFLDIQRQAEIKINERRTRKYDLSVIKRRITMVLKKKIQTRIKNIHEKELKLYKAALYNVQYGLANHELKHLADAYTTLSQMRKIIDFIASTKMSKNLFKNIRNEQKLGLRAIVKKKAAELINNKTLTNIKLPELIPLEEKFALCGPPIIKSENQLLEFKISQKELLQMRKMGKGSEDQKLLFLNALEFNHAKLLKIFNEMERSKSAYLLNSAATPMALSQSQQSYQNGDTRI